MTTPKTLATLTVGDLVYPSPEYGTGLGCVMKVTKVTPKQLQCGGMRFDKATGRLIGRQMYSAREISIPTPEQLDALERRRVLGNIAFLVGPSGKGAAHVSTAELRRIMNTLRAPETHQAAHARLHAALDELLADYLRHHRAARPTVMSLMELLVWTSEQRENPTELPALPGDAQA